MKYFNLILVILALFFSACGHKAKVATLNQGASDMRVKYHYTLYVPRTALVHDPISALKHSQYYVTWDIYVNRLGKISGDKVAYIVGDKSVKHFNKESTFNFKAKSIDIKGVKNCNADNECYVPIGDGSYKIVSTAPKL